MNSWLVSKHALHEISIRLGLKRKVEHTLIPTLDRPSHALTQIIDGAPIGKTNHLVTVHLVEVRTHGCHTCLTLIEGFLRIALAVAREVHVTVVI